MRSCSGSGRSRPNFSRNCATNSWSDAPASPAITTAGSPGASRIKKKFSTMMARRTMTPFATRWAMKESIVGPWWSARHDRVMRWSAALMAALPQTALFVEPGVPEAVVDADARGDQVLHLALGDRRELQLQK